MQIAYHLPSNSCSAQAEPWQFALWQQLQQVCCVPTCNSVQLRKGCVAQECQHYLQFLLIT